jgi:hypothetical protein
MGEYCPELRGENHRFILIESGAVKEVPDSAGGRWPASDRLYRNGPPKTNLQEGGNLLKKHYPQSPGARPWAYKYATGRAPGSLPDVSRSPSETNSPAKPGKQTMTRRQDYSRMRKAPLSLLLIYSIYIFCHSCHKLKNLNNKYIERVDKAYF